MENKLLMHISIKSNKSVELLVKCNDFIIAYLCGV